MRAARMAGAVVVATLTSTGALLGLGSPSAAVPAADARPAIAMPRIATIATPPSPAPVPPPTTPVVQTEEEVQAILAEMEASFGVVETDTIMALSSLNAQYPDVAGQLAVDNDRWVFLVRYFDGADPTRVQDYLAAVAAVGETTEYPIELSTCPFAYASLLSVGQSIAGDPATWTPILGGPIVAISANPLGITVLVDGRDGNERIEVDGVPVFIVEATEDNTPVFEQH